MKNLLSVAGAFFLTLTVAASAAADIRIKKTSRLNMPGVPESPKNPLTGEVMDIGKLPDSIVLIKGARMLTEMRTGQGGTKTVYTRLRQCDLGRELSYDSKSKKYDVTNFSANPEASVGDGPVGKEGGGTVIFTTSYEDTGERQQMFGYTARRVKNVTTSKPSPDACQKQAMKIETDGWYVDLPTFSCPTFSAPEQPGADGGRGCRDKTFYRISGKAETGFAVKETMTLSLDNSPPMVMIHEVTEITKTELDPALFDVPPGYTEDKSSINRNANHTAPNEVNSDAPPSTATTTTNTASPLAPASADETALQPKKPGVVRIGIAKPEIQMPGNSDDHSAPLEMTAAVRNSLIDSLKAENVEAVRLATDAPESEAKRNECDYIFYANVTRKRGGGGMFGKMVAMSVMSVAGAMVPGVGGIIASTVASQVMGQQMGKVAKAKDEFTFDYKVTDLNAAVLSKAVSKAKAKTDGEDVLSTQIKQASAVVLGEIAKKK